MSAADDLRKATERVREQIAQRVRAAAIGLQDGMKEGAPHDTGLLRANFQCGLGEINRDISAPPGSDAVERTRGVLRDWKPGQDIYLTNSLPYAHVAEFGLYGKPPGSANGPKTRGGYPISAQGGFVRLTAQAFTTQQAAAAARRAGRK